MKKTSVFMLLAFIHIGLFAQQDTIYIEEILVEAKRSTSMLMTNISAKSLSVTNPRDASELFKTVEGFGIIKRGNYAMEPVLRGFKYEQLNLQIDGGIHSTAACPNRMDPAISQISPDEVEKIEIIKGPYSVRHGASLGGVINIISKKPSYSEELIFSGSLEGGYETNGSNLFSNLHLQTSHKKFNALLNVSWKDFGNYKSGSGQEIPSSFSRTGYSIKVAYNPSTKHLIQGSWRQGFAKNVLHAGLPMDAEKDNSSMASLDYLFSNPSNSILWFKVKAYASWADHDMNNSRRPNTVVVNAVSLTEAQVFGGRTELAIKGGKKDMLNIGADYSLTAKDGIRNREVFKNPCAVPPVIFDPPKYFQDLVWQDSKISDLGIFLENRFQITEKIVWMAGMRVDMVKASINKPSPDFLELYGGKIDPDNEVNLSANTALIFQLNNGFSIQWAVGRGVRSAEITERYINHFTVGKDAHEYVGDPYLYPEVNYQSDLRVEKDFEKATVYGNVFYSYIQNFISARIDSTLPRKYMPCMEPKFAKRYTNIDESFMYGFEAGVKITFIKKLLFDFGAGYTYAQNISWDEPLPEIPPFMINSSLVYNGKKVQPALKARIAADQNRVAPSFSESTTPGFAVFDFLIAYEPFKFLSLKASVTNILDRNYAEHLSRPYKNMTTKSMYYEPGRSFNFALSLKF